MKINKSFIDKDKKLMATQDFTDCLLSLRK